jgi:hypothetical protein
MAEMLGSALPADVWIDAEGRVRQFEMTIDLTQFMKALIEGMSGLGTSSSEPSSAPASSLPADFHLAYTTRLEMWDFGKPVTITVPDPSDVAVGVSLPGIGGTTGDSFPEITLDTTDTATSDSPATTTADTMVPTDATPVGYPADTTTTVG